MHCIMCRHFWLRWKDVRVQVGLGHVVGVEMIMEHSKPNHPELIASVGISTGWEETGRWEISNVEGCSCINIGYCLALEFCAEIVCANKIRRKL